ncbi:hypothetical protein [Aeromonas salmonicida]|nr:hypothetical protein [Aeromonas salmonicida]WCH25936.1 hypothetical protein ONZ66_15280 [Aeromonas salmonicida]
MTKPHTRDLSAVRPRGCAGIHSIKSIPPQFSSEKLVGEGVA